MVLPNAFGLLGFTFSEYAPFAFLGTPQNLRERRKHFGRSC